MARFVPPRPADTRPRSGLRARTTAKAVGRPGYVVSPAGRVGALTPTKRRPRREKGRTRPASDMSCPQTVPQKMDLSRQGSGVIATSDQAPTDTSSVWVWGGAGFQ